MGLGGQGGGGEPGFKGEGNTTSCFPCSPGASDATRADRGEITANPETLRSPEIPDLAVTPGPPALKRPSGPEATLISRMEEDLKPKKASSKKKKELFPRGTSLGPGYAACLGPWWGQGHRWACQDLPEHHLLCPGGAWGGAVIRWEVSGALIGSVFLEPCSMWQQELEGSGRKASPQEEVALACQPADGLHARVRGLPH